jgi:hypothetical protein
MKPPGRVSSVWDGHEGERLTKNKPPDGSLVDAGQPRMYAACDDEGDEQDGGTQASEDGQEQRH